MSKATISSSKVKILPTDEFLNFIKLNSDAVDDFPDAIKFLSQSREIPEKQSAEKKEFIEDVGAEEETNCNKNTVFLSLNDFHELKKALTRLRLSKKTSHYTYEFLEKCTIILPENEFVPRNKALEARCEKLRATQANTAYMNITKNVDLNIKQRHEDSFAFQLKEVNRQIIAVVQFICSVIAGFVFGFLGIELIVGNLDFGFRLLLGIMCALIIALAEIYFLAKKLNECEDVYANKVKQE